MTAYISRLPATAFPWTWAVAVEYNPEMIRAIRTHIPARNRKWDWEMRRWLFRAGEIDAVAALCTAYCGGYQHAEDDMQKVSKKQVDDNTRRDTNNGNAAT